MRLFALLMVSLLLLTAPGVMVVNAQAIGDTATWKGKWNGVDMTVTIVARGHPIPDTVKQTEPWWAWGNTSTDAYLFYWSSDTLVDLILDFSMKDGHPSAVLYSPITREQRLSVHVEPGKVTLPDDLKPSLVLWPRRGDWLIDGQANFDLAGLEANPTTGIMTWQIEVGAEKPGRPAWSTRIMQQEQDLRTSDAAERFQATVRADTEVPYELATPLMPSWPYLCTDPKEPHYGKRQPIFFDTKNRSLTFLWVGFHIAGMYQINSLAYPPDTDFEAPFAFYRFDPEAGLHPNLVIRSDVWPAGDIFGPPIPDTQRTALRMTWTGKESDFWRYSLTVTGNYKMDREVAVGDYIINAVPYSEYPSWITSKPWKAVTFVEATAGETGSEGIYDYSVEDNWPVALWINGLQSKPPDTFQSPYLSYPIINPNRLKNGFRGEYSLVYNRIPQLYFSPIDNRVHLLNAQGGIWNLGNNRILRMYNLDGGPTINGWVRERVPKDIIKESETPRPTKPGLTEESLYALSGYLIYSGSDVIELRHLRSQTPSSLDIPVPIDRTRWQEFLDRSISSTDQPRDPGDLSSWLNAISSPDLKITGGSISDVRVTSDGFRFVLNILPGFHAQGGDILPTQKLSPGRYVVDYDGKITIVPLTPPDISGSLTETTLDNLEPGMLLVTLRNDGLEDLPSAELEIWANQGQESPKLVFTDTIRLDAQTTLSQPIRWDPTAAGQWTLSPKIRLPDGQVKTINPGQVIVMPTRPAFPGILLKTSASPHSIPFILSGLVLFALLLALICWRYWRVPSSELSQ